MKAAFFCRQQDKIDFVYGQQGIEQVKGRTDLYPPLVTPDNFAEHAEALREVEAVFSTWGMFSLGEAELAAMPSLKVVFYAAGTVKNFARPLLERGVRVVSAASMNAVPVAEFTQAQIVLACKGYFRNSPKINSPQAWRQGFRGRGLYGETIALLGAGAIGRLVIERMRSHHAQVIVWDPFLSEAQASELGVEKVETLDEAFSRGYVVSNHLANKDETVGLIGRSHFEQMREDATFINTGRGAQIVESEMIDVLTRRPDLMALLDVTYPAEPPEEGSPLYSLENVHLSTHIAGSLGDEVHRMADFVIEQCDHYQANRPMAGEVKLEHLATMA